MLTDASQIYRVCSSRPQRILPSQGSKTEKFCGLQLFRFGDFKYNPVFEPRFYEGKDAETIAQLI